MGKVQFGIVVPTEALDKTRRHLYLEDVQRLLTTVRDTYTSAWCVDHLQFEDGDVLEGWTTLTYLAALHPTLQWGHAVLCQSFRNPALVAKMGATLQALTGGRYILGIGAGWHLPEYRAYGYPVLPAATRVEQLDEALHLIKALWTQPAATFAGRHYAITGARCEPQPQPVPPIMVGAFKPRMLRVAARHADWWNVSSTGAAQYHTLVEEFTRACMEVGRDPATVRRTWCGGCACARSAQTVATLAGGRVQQGEDFDFVGTPAQILDQMQPFLELGVDYFLLDCGGFPDLTTVETLITDVLPVVTG